MANNLELLAPAGSMDALKAALANGADAAYLGAAAFGARASAGFSETALREAISLAHLHRKKIYVTVNILVKDAELCDIRKTLRMLAALGADAVILQDLGILKICREEFPSLPVHASTQMALHNASGARLLKTLGARRMVLARECGLDAIRQIAQTGIEAEVFCHGALCVSVSGQCLFSSMIGGRSGNRGRCAQPCRLPYCYEGMTGAFLSPRDLCTRDELPCMVEAGATSFKIEGRLKRPEYVAVVTRAYRNALNAILEGRFEKADEAQMEALRQIFSRGGFTKGYIGGAEDAAIIDPSRVTPAGIEMGTIGKTYPKGGALLGEILLKRPLHDGDGLEVGSQPIRYSGPEIPAGQKAILRLRDRAANGETVRRTEDEAQLSRARATYEGDALNRALPIPFDAVLTAFPGAYATLFVSDGESSVTVQGPLCQAAQNKALDAEAARRSIEKTGGTPFVLRSLRLLSEHAFLPASALNALRREALENLTALRISVRPQQALSPQAFAPPKGLSFPRRLIVKTDSITQIPNLLKAGASAALYTPLDYRREALEKDLQNFPKNTALCLPVQCREETLRMLREMTDEYHVPVCLASPGQIACFPDAAMADESIPVMNGEAVSLLASLGLRQITLTREIAKTDTENIPLDQAEIVLPVYGRTRLMILNHCPLRTLRGLSGGKAACTLCDNGRGCRGTCLTDRMNAAYPLRPIRLPEGCIVELMADKPLHLSESIYGLDRFSYLLAFTDEDLPQREKIIAHYADLMQGKAPAPLRVQDTEGRYLEGVV